MKRVLHTTFALLLALVLTAGLAPAAYAADKPMKVTIPIKVTVHGSEPVPGAYVEFELKALNGGPLGEGVTGDSVRFTERVSYSSSNTYDWTFQIPEMGVYNYSIQMVGGTYYHPSHHSTVYYVDVYNLADGSSEWKDTVEIHTGKTGEGANKYDAIPYNIFLQDITVVKKWYDQDSIRPASVTAELLRNEEVPVLSVLDSKGTPVSYTYPDLELNKSYDWQRKWTGVDAAVANYSVKEVNVPAGYVASYKVDAMNGLYTIINTGALLQTGQLNWPIPVLCGMGSLLVLAGVMMLRRKEEENA